VDLDSVLGYFDEMMDEMDEQRVPEYGRIMYCDTYTKTMIDNARAVTRMSGNPVLDRRVGRLDQVEKIISVPTKTMQNKFIFDDGTAGGGFEADADADNIKMLLIHPGTAICPVISYEFAQLQAPAALSQGKWVYYEESFEDVFIYNKRYHGIQFLIEEA
jgi:hypothetical protein